MNAKAKAKAKRKARAERVHKRVRQVKAANRYQAEIAREQRLIREMTNEGYSYDEIVDELEDEGYDTEDIDEAIVGLGYGWREQLIEAIKDQLIELKDAPYYADMLGIDTSEVYDLYFDSPTES